MKLLQTILFTILAASRAVMADEAADAITCLKNHPHYYTAITDFCDRDDIEIPSGYAHVGKKSHGKAAFITGTCESKESPF